MKEQEATKLEFLMKVNDNIIVQRFFNVRDFNPKAKNSIDIYDCLRNFVFTLKQDLNKKSNYYLLDNQYEIENNPKVLETSFVDGPEFFNIFIKQNDVTICQRQFDAKIYPPKIRYTVDVRPYIKNVLYELTDIFSSEELTYDYLGLPTLV